MTKFAFFDIDGPLMKCFTIYEYAKYLSKKGVFNTYHLKKMEQSLKDYKSDKLGYNHFAELFVTEFGLALKSLEAEAVKEASSNFSECINKYKRAYSTDLISLFKNHSYITVAISGTPIEAMPALADILGFDLSTGTIFGMCNGKYDGGITSDCATIEGKENCFNRFLELNNVELSESFGFGDTVSDLSFLSRVGYAVALNPDKELSEIAYQRNWIILFEEKEVIEKLENMIGGIENEKNK